MVTEISVNGHESSQFSEAFDNPFARKINSKLGLRYLGIVVPKEWIGAND